MNQSSNKMQQISVFTEIVKLMPCQVSIGELLATVRGGFRIYKCYLKDSVPHKNPDHEVRQVPVPSDKHG